jgi:RNA-directed DNA polymerase
MQVRRFMRLVLGELNDAGFRPNLRKTTIRGPGSRRIVLGMLVDGDRPRLTGEYKDMIRLHLYYLTSSNHGPAVHAAARRTSISGIFHHVRGLISWTQIVQPEFGATALKRFEAVEWPPIQPDPFRDDEDEA